MTETQSPETYIGYSRAENFVSPGGAVKDVSHLYSTEAPRVDQWSLGGDWTVGEQKATLNKEGRPATRRNLCAEALVRYRQENYA